MRTVTKAAAALAVAATFAVPAPAQAAEVCVENNQLSFNPPLTRLDMKAGTVTINFQGTCPAAPGLTARNYAGSFTTSYFGSCELALFAEGGVSVYAGGAVYAFVRGTVQVKGELMTTSIASCPIASASGTGVLVSIPEVPGA
jgi:hypothetical protein